MGWINNAAASLWRAGNAARGVFARRKTVPEPRPGQSHAIVIPRQTGGVRITAETALQISAVWACVSVISKDIAASTWEVFEERANGDRTLRRDHRIFDLLNRSPNPEMTAIAFREAVSISALLWGDGYAEIERDGGGRAVNLWPLHPERPVPQRNEAGELEYKVFNPTGTTTIIPARNMFHIHGPGVEGLVGFEVIRLASVLFGHTLAADLFGAAFYANGAHAGQVLETDAALDGEQVEELRKAVINALRGAEKQLGVFIATHGAKLKPQAVEPEKAQFIETRMHLIEEIARWFDVPPHKIGHLLRASFNNIEELGKDYVNKITPWCERLRQEAERKIIRARNIRTRIDLDWLTDGKAADKAEADSKLVNNGIQSRNEVRRRRGLNSLGAVGDKLTVQQAMTTLERIGEEPVAPASPDPAEQDELDENGNPLPADPAARGGATLHAIEG